MILANAAVLEFSISSDLGCIGIGLMAVLVVSAGVLLIEAVRKSRSTDA
jgi:hypothetical protein